MVPGDCDAHTNSAKICNETDLLANEYCTNVSTQYYSYTVEKERLGLWKNKSSSTREAPTTYCTKHNAENTNKVISAPKITLNGSATITLTVGDKYEEEGAKATDEIDGDISGKIETSGAVNTTKAGKYTVTYKVKNSKGKETKVTRTINVKEKDKEKDKNNTTTSENKTTETKNETNKNNTSKNV